MIEPKMMSYEEFMEYSKEHAIHVYPTDDVQIVLVNIDFIGETWSIDTNVFEGYKIVVRTTAELIGNEAAYKMYVKCNLK